MNRVQEIALNKIKGREKMKDSKYNLIRKK